MTTEELLKPRIKIIAPWPQNPINPFHVGDILLKNGIHFTRISNPKSIHEKEIDIYPHLFRKLDWWEERKLEDMPEYVKIDDRIIPVKKWLIEPDSVWLNAHYPEPSFTLGSKYYPTVYPATKEEYDNQ